MPNKIFSVLEIPKTRSGKVVELMIKKITVIGSGLMGSAIAAHFANIGCNVNILDIVDKLCLINRFLVVVHIMLLFKGLFWQKVSPYRVPAGVVLHARKNEHEHGDIRTGAVAPRGCRPVQSRRGHRVHS